MHHLQDGDEADEGDEEDERLVPGRHPLHVDELACRVMWNSVVKCLYEFAVYACQMEAYLNGEAACLQP